MSEKNPLKIIILISRKINKNIRQKSNLQLQFHKRMSEKSFFFSRKMSEKILKIGPSIPQNLKEL